MMQARSQARNNALPDASNMPKLPLEVIHIIFTVSLPPRRKNDRSRFAFLLPLCLVHPSLTRSIQRILFTNIRLAGMVPIRQFLESIKLIPEYNQWVKTLKLVLNSENERDAAEVNNALSVIVEHCVEMEEVELYGVENVNLAVFAQLKDLRSLKCWGLHLGYFEPIVGKSRTFESLVSVYFCGGSPIESSDPSFFAPEVLPSLRQLAIEPGGAGGPINSITDLFDIASELAHLLFECSADRLPPLVDKCTNLLSLAVTICDTVSSARRLSKPLVGLRLWSNEDEESYTAMELLQNALSSGLISASADLRTAIFLSEVAQEDARETGLSEWAASVGLELQYCDGALEKEWRGNNSLDEGYSEFTKWVDEEAARREAVVEQRKIKR